MRAENGAPDTWVPDSPEATDQPDLWPPAGMHLADRCAGCRYDMSVHAEHATCPECGRSHARLHPDQPWWHPVVTTLAFLASTGTVLASSVVGADSLARLLERGSVPGDVVPSVIAALAWGLQASLLLVGIARALRHDRRATPAWWVLVTLISVGCSFAAVTAWTATSAHWCGCQRW